MIRNWAVLYLIALALNTSVKNTYKINFQVPSSTKLAESKTHQCAS